MRFLIFWHSLKESVVAINLQFFDRNIFKINSVSVPLKRNFAFVMSHGIWPFGKFAFNYACIPGSIAIGIFDYFFSIDRMGDFVIFYLQQKKIGLIVLKFII